MRTSLSDEQYAEDRGINVEESGLDRLIHDAVHACRIKTADYVEYIRLHDGNWFRSPTSGGDAFYYRVTSRGARPVRGE